MPKTLKLYAAYLKKMGVSVEKVLGDEPDNLPPPAEAELITREFTRELQKDNRFNRLIDGIVLGMYSILFGILIYVIFAVVLKTSQPVSLLCGGSGVLASLIAIIKGIKGMNKKSCRVNDILALCHNMKPKDVVKVIEILYAVDKKKQK